MKLTLYGSLKSRVTPPAESQLKPPMSIDELADIIGLPATEIKLVMINSRPVHPGTRIEQGDSVALFPKEYPFFADWRDCWKEYDGSSNRRQGS